MSKTSIEWTEQTWNPIVGCSVVSPGCTNCYAMKMAARIEAMGNQPRYAGTTKKVNGNAIWTGKLAQAPDSALLAPLRRKKPTVYFVNSMGDLFHEDVPVEWIDKVFAVMALTPRHTYQVLTKRAALMGAYSNSPSVAKRVWAAADRISAASFARRDQGAAPGELPWPLRNVWLGVSTERQQEADERIPLLLQTPAAIRFISAEPLLGAINLTVPNIDIGIGRYKSHPDLDWVIVGGESGPKARPMHPQWARSLRDQCQSAGIKFFFKQWGQWAPATQVDEPWRSEGATILPDGRVREWEGGEGRLMHPNMASMCLVGKKRGGRLLDGIEHNGFPKVSA